MHLLIIALFALLTTGCATITSGTTQSVTFQTVPEEVAVTLLERVRGATPDDPWIERPRILGKTPLTVQLDKADNQSVRLSREGYKSITMPLTTETDPNFWGNIILGGAIGSTTDSASGAIHQYSPSQYFVTLNPDVSTTIEASTQRTWRDKAKIFLMRRHAALLANLSAGQGEDLSAVWQLLRIAPDQQAESVRKMQALSQVYSDADIFADHLIGLYLKEH